MCMHISFLKLNVVLAVCLDLGEFHFGFYWSDIALTSHGT
jgi:hypothetical protein